MIIYSMVYAGTLLSGVPSRPALHNFFSASIFSLQSVNVNTKAAIRHDEEFRLSCDAFGSPHIAFRWYKNGVYVNHTKATRYVAPSCFFLFAYIFFIPIFSHIFARNGGQKQ